MLTFLFSVMLMLTVVGSLTAWMKRKERRQIAAAEFDGIEEVLASARDHR